MAKVFNFCTVKLLLKQKSGGFDTFGAAFIIVVLVVDGIQWNPSIANTILS